MSAYVVSWDHIGRLVQLGQELGVTGLVVGTPDDGTTYVSLAMYDEYDRARVGYELMSQNRASVAYRYNESADPIGTVPEFKASHDNMSHRWHWPASELDDAAKLARCKRVAEAYARISCYEYQSCENPTWRETFAYGYCDRLKQTLNSAIREMWDHGSEYKGPAIALDNGSGTPAELFGEHLPFHTV